MKKKLYIFKPSKIWMYSYGAIIVMANSFDGAVKAIKAKGGSMDYYSFFHSMDEANLFEENAFGLDKELVLESGQSDVYYADCFHVE